MIVIEELREYSSLAFRKCYLTREGKMRLEETVYISSAIVNKEKYKYMIIYDCRKKVISNAYEFLNFYLAEKPYNTREQALTAIKLFYSFVELFDINDFHNLSWRDIQLLKIFLLGGCNDGVDISLKLKSKRSNLTINNYFGVYRKYFEFLGIDDSILFKKNTVRKYKGKSGFLSHGYKEIAEKYTVNERNNSNNDVVPMYIKVNEFKAIINIVRAEYSAREEMIIRLMFECGLRLGEVLGLTLEDIKTDFLEISKKELDDLGCIFIRNRVSDRSDQMAKSCLKPIRKDDYKSKAYSTRKVGYQEIYPSISLLLKLDEYIATAHEKMSFKNRENYLGKSVADKVDFNSVLGGNDNFYIFLSKNGTPLTKTGWNKTLRKIFKKAGLHIDIYEREHNLSHRFRHGYAMFLKKYQNADELDLKYALRHKSIASVECYFRPDTEDVLEANQKATESMFSLVPELYY
ncbi:TPA: tyrosine-type recombinase/integrase [Bacillus cereus]